MLLFNHKTIKMIDGGRIMINLRHKEILNILNRDGAVSVRNLTKMLFVSEATVRRDLAELEKAGALKRICGGATPIFDTNRQIPLFVREDMDSIAKNEICKKAAAIVKEGNTIFIDGSSSAQYLVKYLSNFKDITIVTNSIKTADLACRSNIKTYCTGGRLIENSLVCVGQEPLDFARKVNLDICFLSCKGVDFDGVFSDTSEEETIIRRMFISISKLRVILMTKNKIGCKYFHTLCHASDIDYLFSDEEIPKSIKVGRALHS